MICRIQNLSRHRLTLDLRGGAVLYVEPNQISPPLREELLYDNVHLRQWIAEGVARRIESHPGELQEHQAAVERQAKADVPEACEADATAARTGKSRHSSKAARAEEPEDEEDSEKRPEKKSRGKAGKE
jgi:hypothetical protein